MNHKLPDVMATLTWPPSGLIFRHSTNGSHQIRTVPGALIKRLFDLSDHHVLVGHTLAAFPSAFYDASLSPMIPPTIRAIEMIRPGAIDSEKSAIPRIAVPTAPIPVHIA